MDITRRGFLKGAIGLAGAGMTGALTVPALKSLLPPPITRCNKDEAHSTLTYKKEDGKWYEIHFQHAATNIYSFGLYNFSSESFLSS